MNDDRDRRFYSLLQDKLLSPVRLFHPAWGIDKLAGRTPAQWLSEWLTHDECLDWSHPFDRLAALDATVINKFCGSALLFSHPQLIRACVNGALLRDLVECFDLALIEQLQNANGPDCFSGRLSASYAEIASVQEVSAVGYKSLAGMGAWRHPLLQLLTRFAFPPSDWESYPAVEMAVNDIVASFDMNGETKWLYG